MISHAQREECVRLYLEGRRTVREIMSVTGIRSEQTVYRILDAAGVPKRPKRKMDRSVTISFDKETYDIVLAARPSNLSKWVCDVIKRCAGEVREER